VLISSACPDGDIAATVQVLYILEVTLHGVNQVLRLFSERWPRPLFAGLLL